ncbi:MAG: alpha/beta fold hydrolase [Actinomycetota bacterium]
MTGATHVAFTTEPNLVEGSVEREFTLNRDGTPIPGVLWSPTDGPAGRLLLLGHGGTAHKRADYIEGVARLATQRGFDAVAIDGPGHGDRVQPDEQPNSDNFFEVWHNNGGTDGIVADWKITLDFLEAQQGSRPTGWSGLSMGTMVGLPVCVTEPRVSAAVLGLMGHWGPNGDELVALAPSLTVPLRFLLQWDDQIVPRERCLKLFDLLGSERKTLHANPGAHAAVPVTEVLSSIDYLDRYVK